MRAENIHFTKKWKKKRKNHFGAKCNKSNCMICSAHKNMGNSSKAYHRKDWVEKDIIKFELKQL